MSDVKTETIPAATETGAHDANDAMTEMIPAATETGAQDTNDAMTETIPSVNETDALAESAEIIWTGPHPAIAESAEIIWSHATMVELAQATADSRPAAETGPASETVHAAGRAGDKIFAVGECTGAAFEPEALREEARAVADAVVVSLR